MKLVIAALAAALLWSAPASAQDGTAAPDKPSSATPPRDTRPAGSGGQSGVSVEGPKVDPKLIIDIFNQLTKPRPRREPPPPPAPAPLPVEPAKPVVAAPAPAPPPPVVAPPQPMPAAQPAAKPPQPPAPPPIAKPAPAPVAAAEPAAPVEAVIPKRAEPAPPAPTPIPVQDVQAAAPPPAAPAQRNASLLSQAPWLLALLAAAVAIAAGAAWARARQIARTRAALSLDPRLDLAEGSCAAGGLALACPPMSIRTRLEFAGG